MVCFLASWWSFCIDPCDSTKGLRWTVRTNSRVERLDRERVNIRAGDAGNQHGARFIAATTCTRRIQSTLNPNPANHFSKWGGGVETKPTCLYRPLRSIPSQNGTPEQPTRSVLPDSYEIAARLALSPRPRRTVPPSETPWCHRQGPAPTSSRRSLPLAAGHRTPSPLGR